MCKGVVSVSLFSFLVARRNWSSCLSAGLVVLDLGEVPQYKTYHRQRKGGYVVLKILLGIGLGFLLFTNPEARQITADLLRSTANAIAP